MEWKEPKHETKQRDGKWINFVLTMFSFRIPRVESERSNKLKKSSSRGLLIY